MTAAILGYSRREWLGMVPQKGRTGFAVTVECGADGCTIAERFPFKGVLPPDQAAKKVEQKGWLLRKGKSPLCPTHATVGRHAARAVEPELPLTTAATPLPKEGTVSNEIQELRMVDIAALSTALNAGFYAITPDVASDILQHRHRRNRNLRPSKLAQLSNDIHTGSFMLNGESIIFDNEGYLIDGQHRLKGCADTGTTILSLVAFGLAEGAMGTVDQGSGRSPSDVLSIGGVANATDYAAIGRLVVAYEKADHRGIQNGGIISRAAVMDAIAIYPEMEDSVTFAGRLGKNLIGLCPRSTLAFCHFILCQRYGKDAVEFFLSRVAIGDDIKVGDPAFVVRKRLMGAGRKTTAFVVEVILRAWLSQLRGKSISNVPVNGEFPALISEKHRGAALKGRATKKEA